MIRKILVAGLPSTDNQFTRAISGYGLEVSHSNGENRHPNFGDFDIGILLVNLACRPFLNAFRDHCKRNRVPYLQAAAGFSEIKSDFENHLKAANWLALKHLSPQQRFEIHLALQAGEVFNKLTFGDILQRLRFFEPELTSATLQARLRQSIQRDVIELVPNRSDRFEFMGFNESIEREFRGVTISRNWRKVPKPFTSPQTVDVEVKAAEPKPLQTPPPTTTTETKMQTDPELRNLLDKTFANLFGGIYQYDVVPPAKTGRSYTNSFTNWVIYSVGVLNKPMPEVAKKADVPDSTIVRICVEYKKSPLKQLMLTMTPSKEALAEMRRLNIAKFSSQINNWFSGATPENLHFAMIAVAVAQKFSGGVLTNPKPQPEPTMLVTTAKKVEPVPVVQRLNLTPDVSKPIQNMPSFSPPLETVNSATLTEEAFINAAAQKLADKIRNEALKKLGISI